jgi:SAM-dependent methyltransferase
MNPPNVMDLLGTSAIVAAALDTGLLRALIEDPPGSVAALASKLALDPRALALVLDVLVANGLAVRQGDVFTAPPDVVDAVTRGPGGSALLYGLWLHTGRFVRTGEPFTRMDAAPEQREVAYRDVVAGLGRMFQPVARRVATEVVRHVKSAARILDVGCGSGIWSLAVAEQVPGAHVTGLDFPAVLTAFEEKASELGLGARVSKIPGDMHTAEIPARSFDLAVLANVLRLEQPASAAALVRKVVAGLDAGGALLVVDALGGGTRDKEIGRTVYAFHLGMRTSGGRVHPPDEVHGWIRDAGLSLIEAIDVEAPAAGHAALIARRERRAMGSDAG